MSQVRKLSPGFYEDGSGTMHCDLVELCINVGLEPTPENQKQVEQQVVEYFNSKALGSKILQTQEDCPKPAPMRLEVIEPAAVPRRRVVPTPRMPLSKRPSASWRAGYESGEGQPAITRQLLDRSMDVLLASRTCGLCGSKDLFLRDSPTSPRKQSERRWRSCSA